MKEKEIIINRSDLNIQGEGVTQPENTMQAENVSHLRRRMDSEQLKNRRRVSNKIDDVKKKKIMMIAIIASVLLIIGIIVWGISNFGFNPGDPGIVVDDIVEDKVSVLLVGADGGGYNTDTIMLAMMDCKNHTVNIMSIPRDTRVPNPYGGSGYAKINSVYAASGMSGLIEQIGEITGLPVNFYVKVDFAGFREAIDVLGGVKFNVPMRLYYNDPEQNLHIDLQPGEQLLNGAKSEQLVRSRNQYAMADIKRTEVQREFIKALITQHANASNLLKVRELYSIMSKYVTTNITLGDAIKYAPSLTKVDEENINMYILPGETSGGGVSYWLYDAKEMEALANEVFWFNVKIRPTPRPSSKPKNTPVPSTTEQPSVTPKPDDNEIETTSKPNVTGSPKPTASMAPDVTSAPTPSITPSTTPTATSTPNSTTSPTIKPTKTPEAVKTPGPTPPAVTTPVPTKAPVQNKPGEYPEGI